jgi:excisionase family DNA binding protein
MSNTTPILLTSGEVSDVLRMPSRRVDKLARDGVIPCIRLPGNEIRFDPREVAEWIDRHRQEVAT